MKRYQSKRRIISVHIKLPLGCFVEIASPQFDWHFMYMGRTGSVVCESKLQRNIYEVQFGDEGAGSFSPENLRIVG